MLTGEIGTEKPKLSQKSICFECGNFITESVPREFRNCAKCLILGESLNPDDSSDPGPSRGRPLERAPQYSTTHSRNSSASSARSMIDERMGWANEERSRSASRPAPEPASPFRESSPYHPGRQKYYDAACGVSMPLALSMKESSASMVTKTKGSSNTAVDVDLDNWVREVDSRYVTCMNHRR